MKQNLLKIVPVVKGEKTYYNIYLFGVAIKPVSKEQYSKLYYQVKGYISSDNE